MQTGAARRWRLHDLLRPVLVAAAIAVTGVACSSGAAPSSDFVDEFVGGALPDASSFQAEILEDSVVEFAEYEQSVLATLACLVDEGLEVQGPELDPDGYTYNYLYRGVDGEGNLLPDSTVNARFNGCYAKYGELVDSVWVAQNSTSVGDAPQDVKDAFIGCLAGEGVTVSPDAHITEIYRLLGDDPTLHEACRDAAD